VTCRPVVPKITMDNAQINIHGVLCDVYREEREYYCLSSRFSVRGTSLLELFW